MSLSIPLVATNDCHYLDPEDPRAHDVLLCIQTGKTVHETKRLKFQTDQLFFKSPEQMKNDFLDYPGAIDNSVEIGNRCNLELDLKTHHFPRFRPESHSRSEDSGKEVNRLLNVDEYLEREAKKGLEVRLDQIRVLHPDFTDDYSQRYRQRLEPLGLTSLLMGGNPLH